MKDSTKTTTITEPNNSYFGMVKKFFTPPLSYSFKFYSYRFYGILFNIGAVFPTFILDLTIGTSLGSFLQNALFFFIIPSGGITLAIHYDRNYYKFTTEELGISFSTQTTRFPSKNPLSSISLDSDIFQRYQKIYIHDFFSPVTNIVFLALGFFFYMPKNIIDWYNKTYALYWVPLYH